MAKAKTKKPTLTNKDLERLANVLPTEEDFISYDRKTCNCPMPYVISTRHSALGRGAYIRLCCLATKAEEFFGLPRGTLYYVMEFAPNWEWDCEGLLKRKHKDGTVELNKRGTPPRWLQKRFKEKGIQVHNLPKGRKGKSGKPK